MGEPSPRVTQAGLGQSQQGNLRTSGGSAAASGSCSSQGLAPGRANWIFGGQLSTQTAACQQLPRPLLNARRRSSHWGSNRARSTTLPHALI